ncbi:MULTISPECIES: hypothetical protein [Thiorhodovibrio]|uniref:hypothetical protein n=1 Tax=Thiorhodovibrio TaxID=61593 RepID=UPI0019148F81|nr:MULTISPECIES: hypothetical protein [Thiorhodovibrio]MBK5969937.1 hypothetical protein [Thiorhodovibrio winogradskyi]WPL12855.1 hypothetical protein Thiosp_02634 [Thiorhodovibrio litoralis]
MATNSILNELHAIRREYAERFNQDLHAICDDARRKQGQNGRRVVAAAPRVAIEKDKIDQVPDLLQLDIKNKSPLIKNKPTLAP